MQNERMLIVKVVQYLCQGKPVAVDFIQMRVQGQEYREGERKGLRLRLGVRREEGREWCKVGVRLKQQKQIKKCKFQIERLYRGGQVIIQVDSNSTLKLKVKEDLHQHVHFQKHPRHLHTNQTCPHVQHHRHNNQTCPHVQQPRHTNQTCPHVQHPRHLHTNQTSPHVQHHTCSHRITKNRFLSNNSAKGKELESSVRLTRRAREESPEGNRQERSSMLQKIKNLQLQLHIQQQKHSLFKHQHQVQVQMLNQTLAAFQQQTLELPALNAQIQQLSLQAERLRSEMKEERQLWEGQASLKQRVCLQWMSQSSKLRLQLQFSQSREKTLQQQMDQIRSLNKSQQAEIRRLQLKNQPILTIPDTLSPALDQRRARRLSDLEDQLEKSNKQIRRLKFSEMKINESLRQMEQSSSRKQASLAKRISQLTTQLQQQHCARKKTQTQRTQIKKQLVSAISQGIQMTALNQSLRTSLEERERLLHELQKQLLRVNNSLNESLQNNQSLQTQLHRQHIQFQRVNQQHDQQLAQFKKDFNQAQSMLTKNFKSKVRNLEKQKLQQYQVLKVDFASLINQKNSALKQLNSSNLRFIQLELQHSKCSARLQELQKQLFQKNQKLKFANQQLVLANFQTKETGRRLQMEQEQESRLKKMLVQRNEQIKALREKIISNNKNLINQSQSKSVRVKAKSNFQYQPSQVGNFLKLPQENSSQNHSLVRQLKADLQRLQSDRLSQLQNFKQLQQTLMLKSSQFQKAVKGKEQQMGRVRSQMQVCQNQLNQSLLKQKKLQKELKQLKQMQQNHQQLIKQLQSNKAQFTPIQMLAQLKPEAQKMQVQSCDCQRKIIALEVEIMKLQRINQQLKDQLQFKTTKQVYRAEPIVIQESAPSYDINAKLMQFFAELLKPQPTQKPANKFPLMGFINQTLSRCEQCATLRASMAGLRAQAESLKEECTNRKQERDRLKDEKVRLESRLKQADQRLQSLKKTTSRQNNTKSTLQQQHQRATASLMLQIKNLQLNNNSLHEQLQHSATQFNNKLKSYLDKIKNVQNCLSDQKQSHSKTKERAKQQFQQLTGKAKQRELQLQNERDSALQKIRVFQIEIRVLKQEYMDQKLKFQTLKSEHQKETEQLSLTYEQNLQAVRQALLEQIGLKESQISALRQTIELNNQKFVQLKVELNFSRELIGKHTCQLDELKRSRSQIQKQLLLKIKDVQERQRVLQNKIIQFQNSQTLAPFNKQLQIKSMQAQFQIPPFQPIPQRPSFDDSLLRQLFLLRSQLNSIKQTQKHSSQQQVPQRQKKRNDEVVSKRVNKEADVLRLQLDRELQRNKLLQISRETLLEKQKEIFRQFEFCNQNIQNLQRQCKRLKALNKQLLLKIQQQPVAFVKQTHKSAQTPLRACSQCQYLSRLLEDYRKKLLQGESALSESELRGRQGQRKLQNLLEQNQQLKHLLQNSSKQEKEIPPPPPPPPPVTLKPVIKLPLIRRPLSLVKMMNQTIERTEMNRLKEFVQQKLPMQSLFSLTSKTENQSQTQQQAQSEQKQPDQFLLMCDIQSLKAQNQCLRNLIPSDLDLWFIQSNQQLLSIIQDNHRKDIAIESLTFQLALLCSNQRSLQNQMGQLSTDNQTQMRMAVQQLDKYYSSIKFLTSKNEECCQINNQKQQTLKHKFQLVLDQLSLKSRLIEQLSHKCFQLQQALISRNADCFN